MTLIVWNIVMVINNNYLFTLLIAVWYNTGKPKSQIVKHMVTNYNIIIYIYICIYIYVEQRK